MAERKLASIQQITELHPIEGADRIELAKVMGWNLVVKKGEFQPQDKCVFFEIDSVLPSSNHNFSFMEKTNYRVKTMKMKGVISQGLALPLSILPAGNWNEGDDVTEILEVTKYEPPAKFVAGDVKGKFPFYVPKTDVLRLQSAMEMLDELKGHPYNITIKYDGTSATFAHRNGEFDVCSRNLSLKESKDSVYWKIVRKYCLQEKLGELGNFAIQGEICGPGIQKNRLGLSEPDLFIFDIYDIDNQKYLSWFDRISLIHIHQLGKGVKPLIVGDCFDLLDFDFLQDYVEKHKYEPSGHQVEGIVIRPNEDLHTSQGDRLIFKIISKEYLLKTGE